MQYNEKKRSIMKIFFQFREYFMLDFLNNTEWAFFHYRFIYKYLKLTQLNKYQAHANLRLA